MSLTVSETCHWCGINQKVSTVFTGLFLIKRVYEKITICEKCFKKRFNNN